MESFSYDPELARLLPGSKDRRFQERYEALLYGDTIPDDYERQDLVNLLDWINRRKGVTERQIMKMREEADHLTRIRDQLDDYLRHLAKKYHVGHDVSKEKTEKTDSVMSKSKEEEEQEKRIAEEQEYLEKLFDELFGNPADSSSS